MKPYTDIVADITNVNNDLYRFWSNASGWAPREAAELLEISRLDWQASLCESLHHWTHLDDARQGDLILAWVNLGSLVEGSLKLFL